MTTELRLIVAVAAAALIVQGAQTSAAAQATARSWSNVMYLGGAAGVRGKSLDWDNKLTIAGDKIIFTGRNKVRFEIATTAVRRLNYTGHKHVNDGAVSTAGLVGLLAGSAAKSTDHYLEVAYAMSDGTEGALLLRLHKENHQDIIDALHAATGIAK